MERTSIWACEYYEVLSMSLSVDPAFQSNDEADALCSSHRAKATEGIACSAAAGSRGRAPGPRAPSAPASSVSVSSSGMRPVTRLSRNWLGREGERPDSGAYAP